MAVQLARALGEDRDRLAARLHQAKHETQALAGALAMAQLRQIAPGLPTPAPITWPPLEPAKLWSDLTEAP